MEWVERWGGTEGQLDADANTSFLLPIPSTPKFGRVELLNRWDQQKMRPRLPSDDWMAVSEMR